MSKLIRSYLKTYFKYWIESLSSLLFIIFIALSLGGLMSGTIQFKTKYDALSSVSQPWTHQAILGDATKQKNNNFLVSLQDFFFNDHEYLNNKSDWWNKTLSNCSNLSNTKQLTCKNKAILDKLNSFYLFQTIKVDGAGKDAWQLQQYNYSGIWAFYTEKVKKFQPNNETIAFNNAVIIKNKKTNYQFNVSGQEAIVSFNQQGIPIFSNLNHVKLYQGRFATKANEIIVDPMFATKNKLKINDEYVFPDTATKVKVVGIGLALDNMNIKGTNNVAYFYCANDYISSLIIQLENSESSNLFNGSVYDIKENLKMLINSPNNDFYIKLITNLGENVKNFSQQIKPVINFNVEIINVQLILYSVLAVILLTLAFVIVIFNLKKEINRTYYQIGLFKAFGYNNSNLAFIFALKCFLSIFVGLVIGYFLSFPLQIFVNKLYVVDVLMPLTLIYFPWQLMLILFFVVPIVFGFIAFCLIYFYLKKDLLLLINSGSKHYFEPITQLIKGMFTRVPFLMRMQVAFMTKNFLRFIVIIIVFGLASLLFILQFSISTIFHDVTNSVNFAYKPDDHIVNFSSAQQKFLSTPDNKIKLKHDTNMKYVTYQEATKEGQFKQAQNFHNHIKDMDNFNLVALIYDNKALNLNGQLIYLDDLTHISNAILTVAKTSHISLSPLIEEYLNVIVNTQKNIVQTNLKTIVSLNEVIYDANIEIPILSVPIILENTSEVNLALTGVYKNNWQNFYSFNGLNKNIVNRLFDKNSDNSLSAIVSQKLLKNNNWKIGQIISSSLLWNAENPVQIPIKIIGAIKYDTLNKDIFVDQTQLEQFFVDKNNQPINIKSALGDSSQVYFYNKLISKQKLFLNKINTKTYYYDRNNINYKFQYFDIVFQDLVQDRLNVNLEDLYSLLQNNPKQFQVYSFYSNNRSIVLPRVWLQSEGYILNEALFILRVFIACLIFLTFLIVCASLLDENRHIIFVLHSFGYKKRQIIFSVLGSYFIGIIIIFFVAYAVSLLVLNFLLPFIWTNFGLLLVMPWSVLTPLQTFGILLLLLVITWLMSNYITKRQLFLLGGYK